MKKLTKNQTIIYLIVLVIMWGANWPLTKLALAYAPPILFAGMRTLIGGAILVIFALPKYKSLRFKENWYIYVISSLFNIILYYGLQTVGLNYMPAGLFSAIVFLQPVLLGLFSWIWLGEAMYGLKIIGLILGSIGVFTLSATGFNGNESSVAGVILALGTALFWSFGVVYMKKTNERVDATWAIALQLLIGGVILTGAGSVSENWTDVVWNAPFISYLLIIAIFVIAIGWLIYFTLVGSGEVSKVGSYTFLIPVVSIVTSTLFLHENITINILVGLLLIVISILLVNYKPKINSEKSNVRRAS
ncbi:MULTISPECIES: DMT family transporter [Paenibacillus]|uniref:DMT family transporter n=1 Tax=Paenibacillus TaxID=44249 RepID=UPI002024DF34|nr:MULTISPECIES: DMT family transporter [Paenibacillus]MCP3796458.1 DMT family transporter [Paenibacillus sp. CH40]URJ40185.1 DMT family transporter [Paenibacillus polymyxa]